MKRQNLSAVSIMDVKSVDWISKIRICRECLLLDGIAWAAYLEWTRNRVEKTEGDTYKNLTGVALVERCFEVQRASATRNGSCSIRLADDAQRAEEFQHSMWWLQYHLSDKIPQ